MVGHGRNDPTRKCVGTVIICSFFVFIFNKNIRVVFFAGIAFKRNNCIVPKITNTNQALTLVCRVQIGLRLD